jgi:hypothetical protein
VPEFFELSSAHARKHFETMTVQTQELAALAQKMTTDITTKEFAASTTARTIL